jgi:hypothetical protein
MDALVPALTERYRSTKGAAPRRALRDDELASQAWAARILATRDGGPTAATRRRS